MGPTEVASTVPPLAHEVELAPDPEPQPETLEDIMMPHILIPFLVGWTLGNIAPPLIRYFRQRTGGPDPERPRGVYVGYIRPEELGMSSSEEGIAWGWLRRSTVPVNAVRTDEFSLAYACSAEGTVSIHPGDLLWSLEDPPPGAKKVVFTREPHVDWPVQGPTLWEHLDS